MNTTPIEHYDAKSRWLHWTTAVLVAFLWSLAKSIDLFPRGPARTAARSVHILVGVALGVIVVIRLRWRGNPARMAPPATTDRLGAIASVTHRVLYLLVAAVVVLGLVNAWARGDSIFGLFRIPAAIGPNDKDLRELIQATHEWAANTLVIVAIVHALAGLFHHFARRDGVLRRMLPPPHA